MPRFLAVYTMQPEDLARFRAMPKSEQDAADAIGLPQWTAWEERHAASFPDRGGMVGKTLRVTRDGIARPPMLFAAISSSRPRASRPPPAFSRTTRISPSFPATASISCPS